MVFEFVFQGAAPLFGVPVAIRDPGTSRFIRIRKLLDETALQGQYGTLTTGDLATLVAGQTYKCAISYKDGQVIFSVNGMSETVAGETERLSNPELQFFDEANTTYFAQKAGSAAIYPRALSATEMEALTS